MKKGKLTAVVPVRAGSQRVKNKNTKPFADSNLLKIKLETLKKISMIDNIVVNSDSDEMLDIALSYGVSTHKREEYYASSECNNSEFFKHIAETTNSDYILCSHVTSPLISAETYFSCVDKFMNSNIENLVTVCDVKDHMWLDGKPLNYNPSESPNSQDLPDIVGVTYGISILSKDDMVKHKNVITDNPYFYRLDEIESIDIDTEFDFMVAEYVYKKVNGYV
jgi:N-acylneuraminate cytidylyltransferase|tara:strand:+ start:650 stop:1315 length:666 start_codon:yes stop_codon:yes gene_type:complete